MGYDERNQLMLVPRDVDRVLSDAWMRIPRQADHRSDALDHHASALRGERESRSQSGSALFDGARTEVVGFRRNGWSTSSEYAHKAFL